MPRAPRALFRPPATMPEAALEWPPSRRARLPRSQRRSEASTARPSYEAWRASGISPAGNFHQSAEQPQFGEIFPVDEVVEHERDEEDRDQDDAPRQLYGSVAAVVRHRTAPALVQRESK